MEQELQGKVALITGASRNQGAAYAKALAQEGAKVAIHYHNPDMQAQTEEVAKKIESTGNTALVVQADLTQSAEVRQLFRRVLDQLGRLDILVHCSGMVLKKPFTDITKEEYDRIFAINTKANFLCMQEAARHIADNGRIISLITTLVGATTGYYSVYAGSKAPVEHFTRALAKEIGHRGVTVNAVAPGPIDTSFFHPAETPASEAWLKAQSVTGELGQISDIVPLITFLASPEARWVTAQTLFINGGFLTR